MATENKKILRIVSAISSVGIGQIGVEPTVDADLNFRMWGGKDASGDVTKWLAKDKPAYITSLRVATLTSYASLGLVRHDVNGDIDGGLITLATLNTLITGSTLDDVGDPRTPLAHASTHENGGADEIDVTGLSGLLADGQTPLAHVSTHENGGADEISVLGLSGLLADGQTPLAHAASHAIGGSDDLGFSYNDTLEPTGFTDPENITVTYDPTARTITLTGTVKARYRNEIVSALVSGWVSDPHTATPTSTLYLKYNGGGFTWSTTSWSFNELQIAYVCFTAAGTFCFAQREVHGFMPHSVHLELHKTLGTFRDSGGDSAGYVLSSTTAADRRPTTSACTLYDEDLKTLNAAHTTKNNYTREHFADALGTPTITKGSAEIVPLSGSNPQYNEWTGATWQLTNIPNNTFMSVWEIAIPTTADSGSQDARYIHITGQSYSSLISTQQSLIPSDLDLGLFSSLSPEFTFITQKIIKYTGGNWTIEDSIRLEGTRASSVSSPSGTYLSTVSADGTTVQGNGTSGDPLIAYANREYSRHVSAATDTVLITDKNIFVDYTATGPVMVTIPDAFLLLDSFTVDIIDSGENATTNNITIQDGSGNIIAVMRTSKMALTIVTDGTNARVK